jgi:hypothetical protein
MEIPENIRIRLLLTVDKTVFRKFYWFEMKGKDFYWGSSYKSVYGNNSIIKEQGATQTKITIPENYDKFPRVYAKYSYHESGDFHYKTQLENGLSVYNDSRKWLLKDEITKPVRFYTLISRSLKHYNKVIKNPNKDNTFAIAIGLQPKDEVNRLYLEFFLSPVGRFILPKAVWKGNLIKWNIATHTISPKLVLIVRFAITTNMNEWYADKEISVILDNLE